MYRESLIFNVINNFISLTLTPWRRVYFQCFQTFHVFHSLSKGRRVRISCTSRQRFQVCDLGWASLKQEAYLLQLNLLGVQLLLLLLQLLALLLEVHGLLVEVLLLLHQVLLKLPHLLVRVGLVLLQCLGRTGTSPKPSLSSQLSKVTILNSSICITH